PVPPRPPRRAGQGAPASRRRRLSGAGRGTGRLLRPEPVRPALQAAGRRHAGAVPDARKKRIRAASPAREPESDPLTIPQGRGGVVADSRCAVSSHGWLRASVGSTNGTSLSVISYHLTTYDPNR